MPTPRTPRMRASSSRLTVMQRSRASWTRWRLTWTRRRLERAQERLTLLQLEMDHQLLRLKELEQQKLSLVHRQQEMQEAMDFRMGVLLLPAPKPEALEPTSLQALLGPPPQV